MRKKFITTAFAVAALAGLAIPASADAKNGGHVRKVRMQDRCDPATFNVAGFGHICDAHSGQRITFADFAADFNPVTHRGSKKWNMHPDMIDIKMGDSLSVSVRGGEFHSFTEVPGFGSEGVLPGCLGVVNQALGLGAPPDDATCAVLLAPGNVPGGPPVPVENLEVGPHYFMCFIHPWMQAVVMVHGDDD